LQSGTCNYHTIKQRSLNLILNCLIANIDTVNAICIPAIDIQIKGNDLGKLVAEFVNRRFILADKKLHVGSTSIEDVEFILGSKYSYCLPETEDREDCSVYSKTSDGIMLKGDIVTLLKDVKYLSGNVNYNAHNVCSAVSLSSVYYSANMDTHSFHTYSNYR